MCSSDLGAGLPFVERDMRETRLPKLDDERYSVVVLGEFNHGKSTFVNALLGGPVLPTGITPTTAVLTHILHGSKASATLVLESGDQKRQDPASAVCQYDGALLGVDLADQLSARHQSCRAALAA